jgi:hypothetical protein
MRIIETRGNRRGDLRLLESRGFQPSRAERDKMLNL